MDEILEPLTAFKQGYSKTFRQHAEELFDNLVAESGIDADANRAVIKKYEAQLKELEQTNKIIGSLKLKKDMLILLIVLSALAFVVGIFFMVGGNYLIGGILLGAGVAFVVLGAVLLGIKVLPRFKEAKNIKNRQNSVAEKLMNQAWEQMKALNLLFDDNMTKQLIEKTVPLIKIDDNFSVKRFDYLSGKYGFGENNNSACSTIGILTGEILGNPFVIERKLIRTIGSQTYTGSMDIHWAETKYDSDGNPYTVEYSQTLYASIKRPKPYYRTETSLVYGNDAAPDLHFSRSASHAERLNEKELEKKVKSGVKDIRARQEKGGNFTEMGNEEFDVLFGAMNRDNEVQFRLLFTPLAQKNLLMLMKNKEGYGDDFDMTKSGCLNFISSVHSGNWDPDTSPDAYYSYSVDEAKEKFVDFNYNYFRSLYFDFAPLLSIPLYQQMKPKEYIYKEDYPFNFTGYESEYAVNRIGQDAFEPHGAATESILKTSHICKRGKSDKIIVTAHSFRAENRIEYVPVQGNDGEIHAVPVEWVEYIPIERDSMVMMKELGLSYKKFGEQSTVAETLKKRGIQRYSYGHGILCCITNDDSQFDSDFDVNIKK